MPAKQGKRGNPYKVVGNIKGKRKTSKEKITKEQIPGKEGRETIFLVGET